jgi:hypothetical protein
MKLVQEKYEELERVGYPRIALEDNPHPYYCLFGAPVGTEPSSSSASPALLPTQQNPTVATATTSQLLPYGAVGSDIKDLDQA